MDRGLPGFESFPKSLGVVWGGGVWGAGLAGKLPERAGKNHAKVLGRAGGS